MKMYYQVQKLKNKQHVLYVKTVKLFFLFATHYNFDRVGYATR